MGAVSAVTYPTCYECKQEITTGGKGGVPILRDGKQVGNAAYHLSKDRCLAAYNAAVKKACNVAKAARLLCYECEQEIKTGGRGRVPILRDGIHVGNAAYHLGKDRCLAAYNAAVKKACNAAKAAANGSALLCYECKQEITTGGRGRVPILRDGIHVDNAAYHLGKDRCLAAYNAAVKKACNVAKA